MPVTILAALPPTKSAPPAKGAGSVAGNDQGAASQGFGEVLIEKKLKNAIAKMDPPATTEETGKELAQSGAEAGNVDPASILAALGLATAQPANSLPSKAVATPDSGANLASDSNLRLAQRVGQPVGDGESMRETETPALAAAPSGDDIPAKFAVPAATVAESRLKLKAEPLPAGDTQEKTIATLANLPAAQTQREAPLAIQAHMRDQTWPSEFSQKIVWMANNDKQSAQITLNPPQMGPIEISLNVDKGSASATFVSANPAVRDAIETALPRLREMFASAGIELGQANVSSESFRQQSDNSAGSFGRSQRRDDNAILVGSPGESLTTRTISGRTANGLVDLFA